jgi:hypothetical protein
MKGFHDLQKEKPSFLPCLVTSAPEDGDMFLRNVGIDLQIHTAPKPETSTTAS